VLLVAVPVCLFVLSIPQASSISHHYATAPQATPRLIQAGIASFYAEPFHGRLTASGTVYDQWAMTAAHRWLPFGSVVEVFCAETCRVVRVTVTDRGPFIAGRIIDLSRAAAQRLGIEERGVAVVGVFQ
jgi:rare lipoprotein A